MKIPQKIFFAIFLLGLAAALASGSKVALGNLPQECLDQNLNPDQCVTYLKNKVSDLSSQVKTLSSQIAVMDNQIKLTEARIEANERQISDLVLDIDTTSKKITGLQESLDTLSQILVNRIKSTYVVGKTEPFQILLSSNDATNFLKRLNYLKIAQEHDRKLIIETAAAKNDYSNQKNILEDKKKQIEALKKQLEDYSAQLDEQKQSKKVLLAETQGSNAKYQDLLDQAQAELAISFGGGTETFVRDVSESETIGTIISGQSGCSTGTHLHFEVHKNGSIDDPNNYLSSKSVSYPYGESDAGSISPHGSWPWPINDPIYITQGYGMTPYAQSGFYGGKPHYGIDMYNNSLTVKASKGGQLYRGLYQCSNGTLYYAKVKHADGVDSLYLHIYPN
ncbi:MAG: hypothetical protein HYU48_02000 [Candidatus Levybacteria bacterium]|nr:hypothetical protein [Candidatus Levybacteria bacterium]